MDWAWVEVVVGGTGAGSGRGEWRPPCVMRG